MFEPSQKRAGGLPAPRPAGQIVASVSSTADKDKARTGSPFQALQALRAKLVQQTYIPAARPVLTEGNRPAAEVGRVRSCLGLRWALFSIFSPAILVVFCGVRLQSLHRAIARFLGGQQSIVHP